jgi:UDP-N-acetylmuramyl-tripeptide synthetase
MKKILKKIIPQQMLDFYYNAFALLGAWYYGNPSKKLFVVGVTGTKGKSSTSELVRTMLAGAGYTVALASTIHFRIGDEIEPNLFKMTMPGHAYLQQFMRRALDAGCTHVVIEMTSEGAKQFRHKGILLDALIFTNLQPEHIESHGSFEKYAQAKLLLAKSLEDSTKRPRIIVANMDDPYGKKFLEANVEIQAPFSLADADPYTVDDTSVRFMYKRGELFLVPLPGLFNLRNILATLALGSAMNLDIAVMKKALERVGPIEGRAERIEAGQKFSVVVDYAHTPDSLKALFETYKQKRIIAVMGSTGGGRDQWKRPLMGQIADDYCDVTILANEDPYDEDPKKILSDISSGFSKHAPKTIFDRREAIATALREAKEGDVVLLTGKGTDPYIMGPRGTKQVWSDKKVAQEELQKLSQ